MKLCVLLLAVIGQQICVAAQPTVPPAINVQQLNQPPKPASLPHLYWHLLMWQNHLDHAAADHEKRGKDGAWLRNYIQKQLGFTDTEFAPVRQSSQHLAAVMVSLDAQAHSLIKADLALYADGKLAPDDRPPNLDKVKQLTRDRETLINSEIAHLNASLGAADAARLKAYITRDFSKNVTVRANPNPPNRSRPNGPTRQALGLEAQP